MSHLVLIYGPPLSGKSSLAWEVAKRLNGKTALVNIDSLLQDAIVSHDPDSRAELEMVHTQVRLLIANYLKNRYHVVVEGAFYYERDGELHRYEQEIDQTISLMRNLASAPLAVRTSVSETTLRQRASQQGRDDDVETALRIEAAYRTRYGTAWLQLTAESASPGELAEQVVERLQL